MVGESDWLGIGWLDLVAKVARVAKGAEVSSQVTRSCTGSLSELQARVAGTGRQAIAKLGASEAGACEVDARQAGRCMQDEVTGR